MPKDNPDFAWAPPSKPFWSGGGTLPVYVTRSITTVWLSTRASARCRLRGLCVASRKLACLANNLDEEVAERSPSARRKGGSLDPPKGTENRPFSFLCPAMRRGLKPGFSARTAAGLVKERWAWGCCPGCATRPDLVKKP